MHTITLASGNKTLLDESDHARMARWKWKRHPNGYASRTAWQGKRFVTVLMHRAVVDAPADREVHHINGDKLDNRRSNLSLIERRAHRQHHAPALVAFQKAHQKYPDDKPCANCGTTFRVNPRKRKRNKCCSSGCAMAMRIAGRQQQAASCPKSRRGSRGES